MRRRSFFSAVALNLTVAGIASLMAQGAKGADRPQRVVRLGFVGPASPSTAPRGVDAFWGRLRELGYVEGQNLVVEARWAQGRSERLPALMAEVAGRNVDVIVTYSTSGAIAARNATHAIPIVAAIMGDPVGTGLAVSLARPGGNLTGLSAGYAQGMASKWLELLHETVPRLTTVALVENPDNPWHRSNARELQSTAPTRHLKLLVIDLRAPEELDRAFDQARRGAQAVVVLSDPFILANKQRVIALAAKHRLPAIYNLRDFVDAGGLIAYAPDFAVMFRRAADYVDKILKGAKPGDLPIEEPTRYVLVVNLNTAKVLGITIPQSILLRADEVIR